jgi:hypothetical protein
MANFEMGEMPEATDSDELAMEGSDYESPEEEGSPLDALKMSIAELNLDELKELEAEVASAISSNEDTEESEEAPVEEEVAPEEAESGGGDLSAMFK